MENENSKGYQINKPMLVSLSATLYKQEDKVKFRVYETYNISIKLVEEIIDTFVQDRLKVLQKIEPVIERVLLVVLTERFGLTIKRLEFETKQKEEEYEN